MPKKTKIRDWLDQVLDCHLGAVAPENFLEDVRGHLNLKSSGVFFLWPRRIAIVAAVALLWVAIGWLGQFEGEGDLLSELDTGYFAGSMTQEMLEFYEDSTLLDSWSRLEDWEGVVLAMAHEDPLVRLAIIDAGQQLAAGD